MNKTSKILSVILALQIIIAAFYSCDDAGVAPNEPVDPLAITVNGKVLDNSGVPVNGAKVSIGTQMDTTDINGFFTLENISKPYDIKVLISNENYGYLFQGLTTGSPQLSTGPYSQTQYSCNLTTTIVPSLTGNERAFVIFTDQNEVQQSALIIQPNQSVIMNVKWRGVSPVNGKLIVFIVNFLNGEVQSYEKYGERSISLNNGGNPQQTFQDNDLTLNPVDSTIQGTLSIPGGYSQAEANFQINYKQGKALIYPFSSGTTISTVSGLSYNFVVPTGLPTQFRYVLSCSAGGSNTFEFTSKSRVTTAGSSNNTVNLEAFSTLLNPPNNQFNVNLSTSFDVNSGSGSGVLVYTFEGTDRTFQVITTQSTATLPDLTSLGINIGANHNYDWSVAKYGSLTSINQFTEASLFNNSSIFYFTSSAERHFTTTGSP